MSQAEPKVFQTAEEAEAEIRVAQTRISEMCQTAWSGKNPWHWSIPAQDSDDDLLLSRRFTRSLATIRSLFAAQTICHGTAKNVLDGQPLPGDWQDGTDYACPGYWRGEARGVRGACDNLNKVLDEETPSRHEFGSEPLTALAKRLQELKAKLGTAIKDTVNMTGVANRLADEIEQLLKLTASQEADRKSIEEKDRRIKELECEVHAATMNQPVGAKWK